MNAIEITVMGNAVTDVDLRTSEAGTVWCTFRLAANERIKERATGAWRDGESTFMTVKCFGRLAEHVARSVQKGTPLVVQGRLNERRYERELSGVVVPGTSLDVVAQVVGPDLNRGVATFTRTKSPAVAQAEGRALAEAGFPRQDTGPVRDAPVPF